MSTSLEAESSDPRNRPGAFQVLLALALVTGGLYGLFQLGYQPHVKNRRELVERTERAATARPAVVLGRAKQGPAIEELELSAGIRASQLTSVVARTTGYVKRWLVDIGDEVKAGQLMAEIETPEREQEILQAQQVILQVRARLISNQAQESLAEATAIRYRLLQRAHGVSDQELAEREAALNAARATILEAKANIAAAEANVKRLTELLAFNKVIAPFAGIVTSRTAEVGAIVNSGTGPSLYTVAQTDPLNVLVHIPQTYAAALTVGTTAAIEVPELPGQRTIGTLARMARALDPGTRTMLAQIDVPNPKNALMPGMYAHVRMRVNRARQPYLVPAGALRFSAAGTQVLEVDKQHKLHVRRLELDVDRGTEYTVLSGLTAPVDVVMNPGDELYEGQEVDVVLDKAPVDPAKGSGETKPKPREH